MINAAVQRGQNVLITGIGGGVALTALQLAVAQGASVYVTSGSQEKIDKAVALGAIGGANYKNGMSFRLISVVFALVLVFVKRTGRKRFIN